MVPDSNISTNISRAQHFSSGTRPKTPAFSSLSLSEIPSALSDITINRLKVQLAEAESSLREERNANKILLAKLNLLETHPISPHQNSSTPICDCNSRYDSLSLELSHLREFVINNHQEFVLKSHQASTSDAATPRGSHPERVSAPATDPVTVVKSSKGVKSKVVKSSKVFKSSKVVKSTKVSPPNLSLPRGLPPATVPVSHNKPSRVAPLGVPLPRGHTSVPGSQFPPHVTQSLHPINLPPFPPPSFSIPPPNVDLLATLPPSGQHTLHCSGTTIPRAKDSTSNHFSPSSINTSLLLSNVAPIAQPVPLMSLDLRHLSHHFVHPIFRKSRKKNKRKTSNKKQTSDSTVPIGNLIDLN